MSRHQQVQLSRLWQGKLIRQQVWMPRLPVHSLWHSGKMTQKCQYICNRVVHFIRRLRSVWVLNIDDNVMGPVNASWNQTAAQHVPTLYHVYVSLHNLEYWYWSCIYDDARIINLTRPLEKIEENELQVNVSSVQVTVQSVITIIPFLFTETYIHAIC